MFALYHEVIYFISLAIEHLYKRYIFWNVYLLQNDSVHKESFSGRPVQMALHFFQYVKDLS